MTKQKKIQKMLVIVLTVILAGFLSGGACDDGPGGKLADQCGLSCPGENEGVASGNASISGVPSIDGFFQACVNFNSQATLVTDGINAELDAIAASVGLAGGADLGAGFQAAVKAKFNLAGDVAIRVQKPKCEVSASASIEATANCDVTVDPGSVEATCEGKCEVDASADVSASCSADATAEVTCTGTAPNLECSGSCSGTCELTAAAACEGTCNGTCNGTCSVENTDGSCAGECDGTCEGSCEMEAGASCSGQCKGTCEYTAPEGGCSADAKAEVSCKGEANAEASVNCSGSCSGSVTPPSASAECQASAKAEAELKAECTPPSVDVSYSFAAGASATAKAEFEAWLHGFKGHISALAAANAKADIVIKAGANLTTAATGAVKGAASDLAADADFSVAFKLACVPAQITEATDMIASASTELKGSFQASTSFVTGLAKK